MLPAGLSIADLARRTRFTKPNVSSAIEALELAELLTTHTVGNERRVLLASNRPILPGLKAPIQQPDWIARFGVALAVHRFLQQEWRSTTVRAMEARRFVESLRDSLAAIGAPIPSLDTFGDDYAIAFDRWVAELAIWLRRPSRG